MLFDLDPSYFERVTNFGAGALNGRLRAPAAIPVGAHGKFLLSINDTPDLREVLSAFEIREIETT